MMEVKKMMFDRWLPIMLIINLLWGLPPQLPETIFSSSADYCACLECTIMILTMSNVIFYRP